jgi:hypothetical protein
VEVAWSETALAEMADLDNTMPILRVRNRREAYR